MICPKCKSRLISFKLVIEFNPYIDGVAHVNYPGVYRTCGNCGHVWDKNTEYIPDDTGKEEA